MIKKLILKNITVVYGKKNEEKIVLAGINFAMDESLVKGIYGNKFSGKTTLARIITNEIRAISGKRIQDSNQYFSVINKKRRLGFIVNKRIKYFTNLDKYINKSKKYDKEILIIDDIEDFNEDDLINLITERKKNKSQQTILLSNKIEKLKVFTEDILYLKNGYLYNFKDE